MPRKVQSRRDKQTGSRTTRFYLMGSAVGDGFELFSKSKILLVNSCASLFMFHVVKGRIDLGMLGRFDGTVSHREENVILLEDVPA